MSDQDSFTIIGEDTGPSSYGVPVKEENKSLDLNDRIKNLINSSHLFLFIKGTPDTPQCGFSHNSMEILNTLRVPFKTFDILSDHEIRDGVKAYSNWPTYPQLYHKGELIGGNDIVQEMFDSGELEKLFKAES